MKVLLAVVHDTPDLQPKVPNATSSPTIQVVCLTCCTAEILLNVANFKMAARKRSHIDYEQLNSFSSVVLYNTAPKKRRKTLPSLYTVERIITRRKMKNVSKNFIAC